MNENAQLIAQCEEKAQQWLSPAFDEETKNAVKQMLENEDKTELIECFYKDLEFGTGGLRGIMGAGSNRMNVYTVGMATQGFANYLKKNFADRDEISVVVCHDCRNNSRLYAEAVANIFAAKGIKAYLVDDTGIVGSEHLGTIFPIGLVAVVLFGVVAGGDVDTGLALQSADGEGTFGSGAHVIEEISLDAVGRKDVGNGLSIKAAVVAAGVAND